MPLMTIVLAHFFTNDEKLTIFKIVGFCFGILGVVVMIGFDKLGTLGEETVRQYAITGAALCYAVNAIVTKSLIQLPRVAMMCALTLVSTLMMLPVFVLNGDAANMVTWTWEASNAVIAVIILAIFPTALGMIMIFMIVSRQGASFLSQINFMVPIFGVLFGILFLAEIIQGNAIIALALILAGVAIARIRPKAKVTYPKEVNS
jgi:drug/metabolite transporter (DMT)-like permease